MMLKHLQPVIKACQEELQRDFAAQLMCAKPPCDPREAAEHTARAWLLELAIIRCFEEQRWRIPSCLNRGIDHDQLRQKIEASRNRWQADLAFPLAHFPAPDLFPTLDSLPLLRQHLTGTIPPEAWRSEHILGWIYQSLLAETPGQKQQGQFYTPEVIADYIVSQALHMAQVDQVDWSSSNPFTLFDLACGCGMFALRAFDYLADAYRQALARSLSSSSRQRVDIPQRILDKHLFLIDIDPLARRIAAISLYLKAKQCDPACRITRLNIWCADALHKWEHQQDLGDSERNTNLKKLFTRKYDVVVGNPPYRVVNQLQASKERIHLYKSYRSAAFKINTFALFVERGIDLLKPQGILGMIVPNTCLTQVYFEPLRQYILATTTIRSILDTKRLFENASVENCIVLLQRESSAARRHANTITCKVKQPPREGQFPRKRLATNPQAAALAVNIPQRHFENAPLTMFNVHLDEPT
ncbi:N-6 DNA methylase, partial [candidate division KSB3 bacterium]|nr:N-6 DNA methylase [candidate division KSB3 bacterium]MBD3326026.1 N-6 DNA methylase [candidate division KSB3 bacterium]